MADLIASVVREKPDSLLCLPAGDTPARTFDLLAAQAAEGSLDCGRVRFVGLDDWLGVPFESEGSCRGFLSRRLFQPLGIPESRIIFFDGTAADPERECARVGRQLREIGPIDLAVLGLGMNGHIGLNEPGIDPEVGPHVVQLDEVTRNTALKYFSSKVPLEYGITLGIRQVMESRTVALMVSGSRKARVLQQALEGPISSDVPASLLRVHPDFRLYADVEAASLLVTPSLRARHFER